MARVNVEKKALSDHRFQALGRLLHKDKYHSLGRMVYLWDQCQEINRHCLTRAEILDIHPDCKRLADSLVQVDLAVIQEDGSLYIRGTKGRIEWLQEARENGEKGTPHGVKGGRPKKTPDGGASGPPDAVRKKPPPSPAPAPKEKEPIASPLPCSEREPVENSCEGDATGGDLEKGEGTEDKAEPKAAPEAPLKAVGNLQPVGQLSGSPSRYRRSRGQPTHQSDLPDAKEIAEYLLEWFAHEGKTLSNRQIVGLIERGLTLHGAHRVGSLWAKLLRSGGVRDPIAYAFTLLDTEVTSTLDNDKEPPGSAPLEPVVRPLAVIFRQKGRGQLISSAIFDLGSDRENTLMMLDHCFKNNVHPVAAGEL